MTSARLVQQVWNVVPENILDVKTQTLKLKDGSDLEAMTSGKGCLDTASPWNSCQPFSGELQMEFCWLHFFKKNAEINFGERIGGHLNQW